MNKNEKKYRMILIGMVLLIFFGLNRFASWQRFRRESPAVYISLASTSKQILAEKGLLDYTSTNQVYIYEGGAPIFLTDIHRDRFPDRVRKYMSVSPQILANRNLIWIPIGYKDVAEVAYLPFQNNQWEIRVRTEVGGNYLLWKGEDGSF